MISKNKAYFGMMGGFDGEVSELPYLARETFINGTIPSKEIVTAHTAARLCHIDINRYAQYSEM